jgi:hypothetical protein
VRARWERAGACRQITAWVLFAKAFYQHFRVFQIVTHDFIMRNFAVMHKQSAPKKIKAQRHQGKNRFAAPQYHQSPLARA